MFQKTVLAVIPAGLVGEAALHGPTRAQPARLDSANAANNVVGRAFTTKQGGSGQPLIGDGGANPHTLIAEAGGTGAFAGILGHPKVYAQANLTGDGLGPLPNGLIAEFFQEHPGVFVELSAAAEVGDFVYFQTADGVLVSAAPTAAAPANCNTTPIGALVRYDGVTPTGGLFVLHLGAVQRPTA